MVIISLAVAANDGCGCNKIDVPPTTAANEVARKDLLSDDDDTTFDSLLGCNENAAELELHRRKMTDARRDFVMILVCVGKRCTVWIL